MGFLSMTDKEVTMNRIPLVMEDTSMEIFARIAKSEARKFDCSVDIDYSGNNRLVSLSGDSTCAPHILEGVKNIFRK